MNQRVLITAGASGIGVAIARAFAATGAKVFVCDLNKKGLNDLKQATPGVMTRVCDVSKRDRIEKMIVAGDAALDGLDVRVNNSGISGQTVSVEKIHPDEWEKVMQVNLNGTFNVTRLAIPLSGRAAERKRTAMGLPLSVRRIRTGQANGKISPREESITGSPHWVKPHFDGGFRYCHAR